MNATDVITPGPAPARAEPGGALLAVAGVCAYRLVLLTWMPSLWLGADLLVAAWVLPWLARRGEAIAAIVGTTPAWVLLAHMAAGGTMDDAGWPALIGTLWVAGLAGWGATAHSPVSRNRISTTWIVFLLGTLLVDYILGSRPTIPHHVVSPLLIGLGWPEMGVSAIFATGVVACPLIALMFSKLLIHMSSR